MSNTDILSNVPCDQRPESQTFTKGSIIFNAHEEAENFLLIESGEVKQVISNIVDQHENNCTLAQQKYYVTLNAGDYVDVGNFFSKMKRSFCSYAKSDVKAWVFTNKYLRFIEDNYPDVLSHINTHVISVLAAKQCRLEAEKTLSITQKSPTVEIEQTVKKSRSSLSTLLEKSDKELDAVITDMASTVADHLDLFAIDEAKQTGIGDSDHKRHKLSLVCKHTANNLLGLKTLGRLEDNSDSNVVEYASPLGVVFAIIPSTNPIPNSLFQSLHAIKTRNTLIVSYPKKAVALGEYFVEMMQSVLTRHHLPKEILQAVPQPSNRSSVQRFMSHPNVDRVLATGGAGLVKTAFSSGTPCLGVGPGNAPTIVCEDADLNNAAQMIVDSKAYDNGIICGSENNIIAVDSIYSSFTAALEQSGAAVLTNEEAKRATELFFDQEKKLRSDIIGLSAKCLAEKAHINREFNIHVLVIPTEPNNVWLAKEKLAPLLSIFSVSKTNALTLAKTILEYGGAGHTASIFTCDKDYIDKFATSLPAGRLLVNTPATFGMMGVTTDLPLSFMLGSGSWGSNLTTDAVTWRDFINIKRLAHHTSNIDINIANKLPETVN